MGAHTIDLVEPARVVAAEQHCCSSCSSPSASTPGGPPLEVRALEEGIDRMASCSGPRGERAGRSSVRRLHVALAVGDLDATIGDSSGRLGAEPTVVVPGKYALWRTDEVNLSISVTPGGRAGLRHLGFEDAVTSKTASTDVNGLTWESFTAGQQDEEIVRAYGRARPSP